MYALIQTHTLIPRSWRRPRKAFASGKYLGSNLKLVQEWARIQKQSKCSTDTGMSRLAMPSSCVLTVCSS